MGVIVASDPGGTLVEHAGHPTCWAYAPTLDAALADLAEQIIARPPTPLLNPLDRRPDLRARAAQIIARALAAPLYGSTPDPTDDDPFAGVRVMLPDEED